MGMDIMKSNGTRCPPILVAGILIMCLYMLCSWWSLSSENSELMKQLDNLAEQLRINGEELGKCSQERQLLDEKLKDSQNRYVQQQIKMEQVKEEQDEVKDVHKKTEIELQESKKKNEAMEKNLKLCQAEMESLKKLGESKDKTSDTLRTENESLKSDMQEKDKQIKELLQHLKTINKTGGVLSKNPFMQSLMNNYKANFKKEVPKSGNYLQKMVMKTDKETNNKEYAEQQLEDKFEGEGKNYGDSGLLSLDNDPREEEMKGS